MSVTLDTGIKSMMSYLRSDVAYPYFIAVGSARDVESIINALPSGCRMMYVSRYCEPDSFPDFDRLLQDMRTSQTDMVVHGLGDYAKLTRDYRFLSLVKDQTLPHKAVLICRGASMEIERLRQMDPKFDGRRWCVIASELDLSVKAVDPSLSFPACDGVRALLEWMERCGTGRQYVHTELTLDGVEVIHNAYEAIKHRDALFSVEESALTDEQWEEYLSDSGLDGFSIDHWRSYLRMKVHDTESPYLRYVMRCSANYPEYRVNLVGALLHIKHNTEAFRSLYDERKALLKSFPAHDLYEYLQNSKAKDRARIHYLTDNTEIERYAIIEELSVTGVIPDDLRAIYPELADYLNPYHFSGDKGDLFTSYFEAYKAQKVTNALTPSFVDRVNQLSEAGNRVYNGLPTRQALLLQLRTSETGLYWMDALGVEYLGFIQKQAKELELRIRYHIGRASLPTITSINRGFYDDWSGFKAQKDSRLDCVKHDGCEVETRCTNPAIHLVKELEIIRSALMKIKQLLVSHQTERMLLVSDHGASRLCVLHQTENRWTMTERGRHSGRCCPVADADACPISATKEKGFWVLANYDRFKGSRLADKEVHGGASLEEVLVPIIEIALADRRVDCYIPDAGDPAVILKPLDEPPIMRLFCTNASASITVRINGCDYQAQQEDANSNMFLVRMEGQWRVGVTYTATTYDGDQELSTFRFVLQRAKRATRNDRDGSEFFGA